MTRLTVELRATQVTTTTKTPEELQQEAEQSGGLRVESEFSWWFPWFTLHFIYVYGGQDQLDVGISLFGADDLVIYNQFESWIKEYVKDIVQSIFIGWLIGEAVVLAGSWGDIWTFTAALVASLIVKGVLLSNSWDSVQKLQSAFVATFISIIISVVTLIAKFLPSSLIAMANNAVGVLKAAFNFLYKFIIIPVNIYLLFTMHDRLVQLGSV